MNGESTEAEVTCVIKEEPDGSVRVAFERRIGTNRHLDLEPSAWYFRD